MTSFAYHLKYLFCNQNKLDFDRFINERDYKEFYRVALTAFLDENDPYYFTKVATEMIIQTTGEYDIYIFDDLRVKKYQIDYIFENYKDIWNIYTIRINSSDSSREKRGWISSEYDSHYCENELDTYDKFDIKISNDSTIEELNKEVLREIGIIRIDQQQLY